MSVLLELVVRVNKVIVVVARSTSRLTTVSLNKGVANGDIIKLWWQSSGSAMQLIVFIKQA